MTTILPTAAAGSTASAPSSALAAALTAAGQNLRSLSGSSPQAGGTAPSAAAWGSFTPSSLAALAAEAAAGMPLTPAAIPTVTGSASSSSVPQAAGTEDPPPSLAGTITSLIADKASVVTTQRALAAYAASALLAAASSGASGSAGSLPLLQGIGAGIFGSASGSASVSGAAISSGSVNPSATTATAPELGKGITLA